MKARVTSAVAAALMLVLSACGGDDDGGGASGTEALTSGDSTVADASEEGSDATVDSETIATEMTVVETVADTTEEPGGDQSSLTVPADGNAGSSVDTTLTDADVGAVVLQLADFGSGWQTDGVTVFPDDVELDVGEPTSVCPGGPVSPLSQRQASIQFETDPFSELYVSQDILQFDGDAEAVAALDALEACVGEEWTVEGDPDEDIRVESLDVGQFGDESVGFHFAAADGHGDALAVVRLGDVLIQLGMPSNDASQPLDAQLFDELLTTAVARAAPIIGS